MSKNPSKLRPRDSTSKVIKTKPPINSSTQASKSLPSPLPSASILPPFPGALSLDDSISLLSYANLHQSSSSSSPIVISARQSPIPSHSSSPAPLQSTSASPPSPAQAPPSASTHPTPPVSQAPVQPYAQAPAPAPARVPAQPPAQAPVQPYAQAPAPAPARVPAQPPAQAPVQPYTQAPAPALQQVPPTPTLPPMAQHQPRTGPVAMPPPTSKHTPRYSTNPDDLIADFLEHYKELATSCGLMDQQKVEMSVHYTHPTHRNLWQLLDGYTTHDWAEFHWSLEKLYSGTSANGRYTKNKLYEFIKDKSQK
ncbi:hypothetical protein F5148DRAFT_1287690 [Russula earlei]|uniref:Uncharacterized protein n=1 Tax=Russula earlei TaxID=71964 RepID=A0ACC0U173_9AGAM|nr:hypothetical protein F5148DRAFT_1287690 [Russula earlei]